ncbi:S-adenosylmethionine uptake transporter [Novosphingobium mathurense]|uniref:S-adenosylmethionine uptake transporter n=1 Tax=Novosphingobium mathurense TaxID=428990 RepID=A0A1U6HG00_9SPHN|nr:DMT family transporter [Novosphingobium mathurense]SLJ94686.1 S-adenosylmethionine uptake transporter [Novosphingobium mathurense]
MQANSIKPVSTLLPVLSVCMGIVAFSAMDAAMKGASIAIGVFSALLFRYLIGTVLTFPIWFYAGRPLPDRSVLIVHVQRAAIVTAMAALFFYGVVRVPLAEAVALSFIAPIVALYFASLLLGEIIRPRAIVAAAMGIVGVLVIGAGRLGTGTYSSQAIEGVAATLGSAMFYALNLVFQRKQALVAGPVEIAMFQNLIVALILLTFSPWLTVMPDAASLHLTLVGAVLATMAILFLSWGYARAEAQVLLPIEYTAFLWAALFGWLQFGEEVGITTVLGAVLIVIGCLIGARNAKTGL